MRRNLSNATGIGLCVSDNSLPYKSGLRLWLDADDPTCAGAGTTYVPYGGMVGKTGFEWKDKSGRGNHAKNYSTVGHPTYETSNLMGSAKPVVRFNGFDDFLIGQAPLDAGDDTYTVFALWSSDVRGQFDVIWEQNDALGNTTGTRAGLMLTGVAPGYVGFSNQNNDLHELALYVQSTPYVTVLEVNNSIVNLYNNKILRSGTINASTANISNQAMYIGSKTNNTENFDGDIAEIIVYDKVLSSGNRDLITDYLMADASINVTCSNDTSLPYQTNLQLWLDANDVNCNNSNPANGSAVNIWKDKSGKFNNATSAGNPAFVTNTFANGSIPSIRFDGNGDYFVLPKPSVLEIQNSDYEIFITAKTGSTSTQFILVGANEQYSMGINESVGLRFTPKTSIYSDAGISSQFYGDGYARIFSARVENGTSYVRVDGFDWADTHAGATSSSNTALLIGKHSSVANPNYFNGDIGEVLIYSDNLDLVNRRSVEVYLKAKWGAIICQVDSALTVKSGLQLWLDAKDPKCDGKSTTFHYSNGSNVGQWKDKSGFARDAIQFDSTKQPSYTLNVANSNPVMRFDGSNDGMSTYLNLYASYTVSIVFSSRSTSAVARRALQGHHNWLIGPYGAKVSHYAGGWVEYNNAITAEQNRFYVATATNDTSQSQFYIDGLLRTESSTPVGSPGALSLAAGGPFVNEALNGDIAEVIVYNRVLSNSERDDVTNYLGDKWDVDITACADDTALTYKTGLQAWYDARDMDCDGDASNNPANGTVISTWMDKSAPYDRPLTASGNPTYDSGSINMDGVGDIFNYDTATNVQTVFAVVRIDNSPNAYQSLFARGGGNDSHNIRIENQTINFRGNGLFNEDVNDFSYGGDLHMNGVKSNNSSYSWAIVAARAANAANIEYSIGQTAYNRYWKGNVSEILIYDSYLSDASREIVEIYLSGKWNIPLGCADDTSLTYKTGLQGWYDASDTNCDGNTDSDAVGTNIYEWKDKSSSPHRNLTSSGGPSVGQSVNNLPTIALDGNDMYSYATSTNIQTVFAVAKVESSPNSYQSIFAHGNGTDSHNIRIENQTTNFRGNGFFNEDVNDFTYGGSLYINGMVGNSYGSTGTWNIITAKAANLANIQYSIGQSEYSRQWKGGVAEVLLYNTTLSDANKNTVEAYLGNKWGIAVCADDRASIGYSTYLALWLDAADPQCNGQYYGNNTSVALWKDKSGSGADAEQATTSAQPTYVHNTLSSKPVVRFDGGNDFMLFPDKNLADNFTISMVVKPDVSHQIDPNTNNSTHGTSGQKYLFWPDNISDPNSGAGISLGTNGVSVYEHSGGYMPALAVYDSGSGGVLSSAALVTVKYGGKVPNIYVGGSLTEVGLLSPKTKVYAPNRIGTGAGLYGAYDGDVAEILMYSSAISDADRKIVESYLSTKWGIQVCSNIDLSLPHYSGIKLWLDANDPQCNGNHYANGSKVSEWKDKSGNRRGAIQNNDGMQPIYVHNGTGGKPVTRFDGTNDVLATTLNIPTPPYTISVLFNYRNSVANVRRAIAGSNNWLIGPYSGKISHYALGWVNEGIAVQQNRYYIATAVNNGSASNFYVDGYNQVDSTSPGGIGAPGYIYLGAGGVYPQALDGDIAEVIVYNEALSDTSRFAVETYMANKWGIRICDKDNSISRTGLVLWLDADNVDCTGGWYPNGHGVTTWYDKSGNQRDFYGSNAASDDNAKGPNLSSGWIGTHGRRVIVFHPPRQENFWRYNDPALNPDILHLFIVAKAMAGSGWGYDNEWRSHFFNRSQVNNITYGYNTYAHPGSHILEGWSGGHHLAWNIGDAPGSSALNSHLLYKVAYYNGSGYNQSKTDIYDDAGGFYSSGWKFGNHYKNSNHVTAHIGGASGTYWNGFIGEVVIYGGMLSPTTPGTVLNHLRTKWEIY